MFHLCNYFVGVGSVRELNINIMQMLNTAIAAYTNMDEDFDFGIAKKKLHNYF